MAKIHASGAADITIASLQSIISGERLEKYNPKQFKLILVDEAHHAVTPGYLKTLSHFGLDVRSADSPALVGVSATFSRFDGLKLGAVFDHIVYHKNMVDMIEENWLSGLIFSTVKSDANLSRVKNNSQGDFQLSDLSKAVNTAKTNEITVQAWLARAEHRKSTLVFCVDIMHLNGLTDTFRKYGIDARYVTGDTKKHVRSEILDAFKNGEFPVLLNCGVFTEGTDIPNIDCVLLARPTRSRNLLVQMIGRGARLYPGKENCHVIDMVSTLDTGVVTAPTLFGLDPAEVLEEAGTEKVKEIKQQREEQQGAISAVGLDYGTGLAQPQGTLEFTDYDSILDLIDDTSGERHIRAISQNAWVQVGDNRYVVETQKGRLTIKGTLLDRVVGAEGPAGSEDGRQETEAPGFVVEYAAALPMGIMARGAPYKKVREVARAWLFADAVHAADTFAAEKFEHFSRSKTAKWRTQPASDSQLAFLNRAGISDEPLDPHKINKGKAADMITKIKHGGKGRFAKMKTVQRRQERERSKAADMARREEVSVGPLSM